MPVPCVFTLAESGLQASNLGKIVRGREVFQDYASRGRLGLQIPQQASLGSPGRIIEFAVQLSKIDMLKHAPTFAVNRLTVK